MHDCNFKRVCPSIVKRLLSVDVDLFVEWDVKQPPALFHRAGAAIDAEHLATLAEAGNHELCVRSQDFGHLSEQVFGCIDQVIEDDSISPQERYTALQFSIAAEMERVVHANEAQHTQLANDSSKMLVSLIDNQNILPIELFRLSRHDSSTFNHVANVAAYSVILGKQYGITDPAILEQFTAGALLHDIGKYHIPLSILQKPGPLSIKEREVIKSHPTRGYEALCTRSEINCRQLMMVYQHHERIDGTGYPVGVQNDEIDPWAKLLAVVDVFDALTGARPYRKPMNRCDALAAVRRGAGTHFCPEAVDCWISSMSQA